MSDSTETKQCSNCKLEILSSNYTVHTVHCHRNFYLCSFCEQPVNFNDKDEHDNTNHVVVKCNNCQLALEKFLLDDHLANDCPHRKVKCQICDIEVEAVEINEHENYCGSRTEKCSECGEFVMLKYKSLHIDSNHTFIKLSDEPGPSPSWQYGRRTLCNFMPDLTSKDSKPVHVRKRKSSERLRRLRSSDSHECTDDADEASRRNFESSFSDKADSAGSKLGDVFTIKTSVKTNKKDIDEWPALSSLRSLQISDKGTNDTCDSAAGGSSQNEESDLMYAIQVSQEINSDVWRKDKKSKEEEIMKNCFKPISQNELSSEKLVRKSLFESKKHNKEARNDHFENDFNFLCDESESVKLPCEFCGALIVSNDLILHQSRCSLYMSNSFNGRISRSNLFFLDDDMERKIPCGICNKVFKLSLLENHELHCRKTPSRPGRSHEKLNYSKNLKAMNMKSEQGIQNGLAPSSPQLTRVGTRSEWLSELSKSNEENKDAKNNLNHSGTGAINKTTRISRKNRRAPSPPMR